MLKLSADDVIVSQKRGSNRAGKLIEYGRDYFFTRTLCAKFFFNVMASGGLYSTIYVTINA